MSHTSWIASRTILTFKQCLKFYGSAFIITLILFRWRQLRKSPLVELKRTCKDIIRASTAFSLTGLLGQLCYCIYRWNGGNYDVKMWVTGIIVGIPGFLIEKMDRICELSVWMIPRLLPCFDCFLKRRGILLNLKTKHTMLFCLANSAIMYAYSSETDCIRNSYVSLLKKFLQDN